MVHWDITKLKTKSVHERHQLWINAREKMEKSSDAKALVQLIESSGLDYGKDKTESVSLDHPICKKMRQVILSDKGVKAALEATAQGLPALAGVDQLLQNALGPDYGKHNEATVQAGYLMTGMMEGRGYVKAGEKPMPSGCIAKTALVFLPGQKP